MFNKLSEIYLNKNKDILEPFDKKINKVNKIKNMVENYDRLIEGFPSGKCPGGRNYDCNYTYETIKDNENTTKCNSSCEKTYSYRLYERQNNDPTSCRQSKTTRGTRHYFGSCDKQPDTNFRFESEIQTCQPGEGDCPHDPVDCVSSYGKCQEERLPGGGRKCVKKLNITTEAAHGGTACPSENEIQCPPDGDGCPFIPVDCEEGYGDCKLNKDGKCVKENIIYQNPIHGGKECSNAKFIDCKDGEGSCPTDCVGKFSLCNSKCFKAYQVSQEAKNGGKKCPYINGHIENCEPGESGSCQENKDCVGSWSKCDNNCFKTFEVKEQAKGNGSCRLMGKRIKCTKDDEFRCRKIPKDCDGKWGKCNSKCKRKWIKTKEESDGGKCDYNEKDDYDCEEGVDDCEVSLNCYGRWTECDSTCIREWKVMDPARGLQGKCEYPDGKLVRCNKGEGLCGSDEIKKKSSTDEDQNQNNTNNEISQESKNQQMTLYGIIFLLFLIIIAVNL